MLEIQYIYSTYPQTWKSSILSWIHYIFFEVRKPYGFTRRSRLFSAHSFIWIIQWFNGQRSSSLKFCLCIATNLYNINFSGVSNIFLTILLTQKVPKIISYLSWKIIWLNLDKNINFLPLLLLNAQKLSIMKLIKKWSSFSSF